MIRPVARSAWRVLVACAAALVVPLIVWAQAPPAQDSAAKQPPTAAVTQAPALPAMPALSDSVRAAVRAQAEREFKAMADTLKLTQEQRDKARPILLDQAYQARQLRVKYGGKNQEAMTKDLRALREAGDARMAMVLTGEQMAKYKTMRDAMMARGKAKLGIGAPAAPTTVPTAADTTKK